MPASSQRGQHAGENLEPQVLFIAEPVGAALEDTDLVVQSLDEPEGDLVFGAAVGGNPVPVLLNHRGKSLLGRQALPLQSHPPALEEAPRPALAVIAPELPERFFEQVRRVEPLVLAQQGLQGPPAVHSESLPMSQQSVLRAL